MMKRYYERDGIVIYHADCRELLPTFEAGQFDLCLTDPPYGINHARARNSQEWGWRDYGLDGWDRERVNVEVIRGFLTASKLSVVWGGNYYTDALAPTAHWLVWDKGQRNFSLADCELAWCSNTGAARVFTFSRAVANRAQREHPTQKPVELMEWCLGLFPKAAQVLDPFLGSGTTAVAAARLGRQCVGIELEEKYCEIAAKRIDAELDKGRLFSPAELEKPQQLELTT